MEAMSEYWLEDIETASRVNLERIQLEKLKKIIAYVEIHSEFYKKKFRENKVSSLKIQSLKDLCSFPLTSREEIVKDQRENSRLGSLMCTSFDEPGQTIGMTGVRFSATGEPIRVILSIEDAASQGRLGARGLICAGVERKDYLYIADFPQFNLLYMHLGLGSINLGSTSILVGMERGERNVHTYTPRFPPSSFYISPTYSKFVTRLLKDAKMRYPIHAVLGWSEPGYSLPSWKERFRGMWGEVSVSSKITICDVYGLVELGLLGFECINEMGLHGFEDAYIYEIINPKTGDILKPGNEGELVITHLEREGMPLIRYRTGDITSIQYEPCNCGRTHLRLMGIKGRLNQGIKVSGQTIFQSNIEEALGSFKGYSGDFNATTNGSEELSQLDINIFQGETSKQFHKELEDGCSKKLGVPVAIHLKAKEDLAIFTHRSQKVFNTKDWDLLKKEADKQLRAEA